MNKQAVYQSLNEAYFGEDCDEKDALQALVPIISAKKCFIDVGASLGQYTRFANRHMTNGVIYAIEPDPIRFEELRRNCKKWERLSTNRLIPIHAAVTNESGSVDFFTTNSSTSGTLLIRDDETSDAPWDKVVVDGITLDDFVADKKPDFIKIDVNGAELRALEGAQKLLKQKVAAFFVDIDIPTPPAKTNGQPDVHGHMAALGYVARSVAGRPLFAPRPKAPPTQWQRVKSNTRRLLRPGNGDAVSMYHQPLFSEPEKVLYRLAAQTKRRSEFYSRYYRFKQRRRDMLPFMNKHRGERCFIMGGGPSLKKCDPQLLANESTFGVNGIFLLFDWLGFQPTYYAVEDWFVYEDRFGEIKRFVTEPECFFPLQFSGRGFDRPNHHYFRALYEFNSDPDWPNFSTDAARMLWIGGTVTYICLQLAYFMGFKEVFLIGIDHNYVKPEHVQTTGNEWLAQGDDPNHFHPDYFGKGYRCHDPKVERMEKAYVSARKAFEADGRKVYNATIGGALEVFERRDFFSLFRDA